MRKTGGGSFARVVLATLLSITFGSAVGLTADDVAARVVLVILFDPTVFQAQEVENIEKVLNDLKGFYATLPYGSRVVAYSIERRMNNRGPIFEKTCSFTATADAPTEHRNCLTASFGELRGRLLQSWRAAHAGRQPEISSSCVLSALWFAGREVKASVKGKAPYKAYVLVMSDMVESCDEWGEPLIMERGVGELHSKTAKNILGRAKESIDLSVFERSMIVHLPSRHFDRPPDIAELERFWVRAFAQLHGGEGKYSFSRGFPDPPWVKARVVPGALPTNPASGRPETN